MASLRRFPLSPPATGLIVGFFTGLLDSFLIDKRWISAGVPHVVIQLTAIWTWMTACGLAGLVASSRRFERLRWAALLFSGPGLMLAGSARRLRFLGEVPGLLIAGAGLAALGFLAFRLARVPLAASRAPRSWIAGLSLSALLLAWVFADIRPRDLLPRPQDTPGRPPGRNVAVIFLDTVRHQDALGTDPAMPRLAAFAERSIDFRDAWAPASWTVPSHRAVFTGIDPWLLPKNAMPLHLAARFRRAGYATASVFSNGHLRVFRSGFEEFTISRGSPACSSTFARFVVRGAACRTIDAADVTRRARRFLRRAQRPWFLAVNYMDAHDPYPVPRRCRDRSFREVPDAARKSVVEQRALSTPPPAELRERVRQQYRTAMRCMDATIAPLLEELAADPDTIVAVLGDHGEEFGEHGTGGHASSIYRQAVHVPLVLRIPGVRPAPVNDAVSISDLHDTLLAAAGLSAGRPPLLDPGLRRPAVSQLAFNPGERGSREKTAHGFSVAVAGLHLIRIDGLPEMLFRYTDDPLETRPLDPASVPGVDALRAILLREEARKRGAEEFNALGYLNR